MDYAEKHRQALEKLTDKGVAVQFSTEGAGDYDPLTDTWSGGSDSAVGGRAVEIPAEPEEYELLDLVPGQDITLMFVPTVYGQVPPLNSSIQWAGAKRTVKRVLPIRPDGNAILSRVVVS